MECAGFKFSVIRETLAEEGNVLTAAELCDIAGVSRSGYYGWMKAEQHRQDREERDRADFRLILSAYRFRGYGKGVRGILLTDITCIPLNGSHCYLSTILDACTKQVLSYTLSESLEVDFVLETVRELVENHGISLNS